MTGTRGALIAMGLQLLLVLPLIAWRCRRRLAFGGWARGLQALAAGMLVGTVLVLGVIPSGNPQILEEGHGATPWPAASSARSPSARATPSLNVRMVMWRATLKAIARGRSPAWAPGPGKAKSRCTRPRARSWKPTTTCTTSSCSWSPSTAWSAGCSCWLLFAYLLQAAWRSWRLGAPRRRPSGRGARCSCAACSRCWWSATSAFRGAWRRPGRCSPCAWAGWPGRTRGWASPGGWRARRCPGRRASAMRRSPRWPPASCWRRSSPSGPRRANASWCGPRRSR